MKNLTRTPALPMLALGALVLSGCMGANYYTREDGRKMSEAERLSVCARLRKVEREGRPGNSPYLRDSVNTMANAGYENAISSMAALDCDARYAEPERRRAAEARWAAQTERWVWQKNANAESEFRKRMDSLSKHAALHYPPAKYESCVRMEGRWFAECVRREGSSCVEASRVEGVCMSYAHPNIEGREACDARKARFLPECAVWQPATKPGPLNIECARAAAYGTCRAPIEARPGLVELSVTGGIVKP